MVVEAGFTPNGEQFTEGSVPDQSGVNPFDALIEQQRLNLPDIVQYYDMWVNMHSELYGDIPEEQHQSMRNISFGLGFLFYQQWGEMGYTGRSKQVAFQKRLERHHIDQFTLPYGDAKLLQRATSLVDVEYDPGEPENTLENIAKRTFQLAGSEDEPPKGTIV
jgi:hypothetical protein